MGAAHGRLERLDGMSVMASADDDRRSGVDQAVARCACRAVEIVRRFRALQVGPEMEPARAVRPRAGAAVAVIHLLQSGSNAGGAASVAEGVWHTVRAATHGLGWSVIGPLS